MNKINRTNIGDHLVEYQLNMVGKTIAEAIKTGAIDGEEGEYNRAGTIAKLLETPEKIGEILANMVAAVKIPVTVKIRAGWDSESILAPLITQIAENAGASAICIHGRTRAQAYRGPANWDYILEAKKSAKKIKIIAKITAIIHYDDAKF